MLLTTQYLEEADRLADEIVVIDHGKVIAAGTPRRAQDADRRPGPAGAAGGPDGPGGEAEKVLIGVRRRRRTGFHDDGQLVTVSIADRSALGQAVRRLDDAGIVVDDLSLRRPSLDEVFLTLTGHSAEERA